MRVPFTGVWTVAVDWRQFGGVQESSWLARGSASCCSGRRTHRVHEQHGHVVSPAAHHRGPGECIVICVPVNTRLGLTFRHVSIL